MNFGPTPGMQPNQSGERLRLPSGPFADGDVVTATGPSVNGLIPTTRFNLGTLVSNYQAADAAISAALSALAASTTTELAAKQDALGFTPVNRGGDTMTGPLVGTTATFSGTVSAPRIENPSANLLITVNQNSNRKLELDSVSMGFFEFQPQWDGNGFWKVGPSNPYRSRFDGPIECRAISSHLASPLTVGNSTYGISVPGAATFSGVVTATGAGNALLISRPGMSLFGVGDANGDTFRVQNVNAGTDLLRIHGTTRNAVLYGGLQLASSGSLGAGLNWINDVGGTNYLAGITYFRHGTTGTVTGNVNGNTGAVTIAGTNYRTGAADPTTLDLAAGFGTRWKNTTNGEVRDWVNDGGVMKKSAAYT